MKNPQSEEWPLPVLKITRDFTIQDRSLEAEKILVPAASFLDLLDEDSRQKAENLLPKGLPGKGIELNFLGRGEERFAADVHVNWNDEETATLVIVPHAESHRRIAGQFTSLRQRLNETNYDLLLEKMKVDELVKRVRELSAPLIRLDRSRMLIPLFGDLTVEQMAAVQEKVLSDTYASGATKIILDFTAVDLIDNSGLQEFNSLLQSLSLMGTSVTLTGLHPDHARRLNELDVHLGITYASSLQDILQ
ncbi:STAS domain-containing protein [Planococcus lenghuensis]|uniref:STAS domain-containing protein n=1 Tax=Planococcus lenghuensis TaxID=2213202 RepID=A0A1Q2L0M9_9BACL|nr:STAS domain-containing protein [Planococcus lenghuensis]AQQ54015.1 hypothetical protein B0X71_13525 [Planococcus lenghuensis]